MSDIKPLTHVHGEDDAGDEMPRQRRTRILKKGKIIFQGGLRSIPCIVRNLSEGGAMLQFEQAFLLPQEFQLQMDLDDFEVTCVRRWEDGLQFGVQFISEKRSIGRMRAQVLKSSEDALTKQTDEQQESLDGFFQRRHMDDPKPVAEQPVRRTRPAGSGKPGFGKRR